MHLPRLWIVLSRPDNIVAAFVIAAVVSAQRRFESCHLVYERSAWWHHVDWAEYRSLFASVHPTPKVQPAHGLLDAVRYVRELRQRQSSLAALGIDARDSAVALAGDTDLANAVASAYPSVPKVLCLPANFQVDAGQSDLRQTASGWLPDRFLAKLGGVRRTARLEKQSPDSFRAVVLLGNEGGSLPPTAGGRLFTVPFPGPADLAVLPTPDRDHETDDPRAVVFFGTPFLRVRNIDPRLYSATLNGCLDYLRRHYGENSHLIYRPHPAETSERRLLRLRGFIPQDDLEVAELYLLKNLHQIKAVYSVASTVSRVAFNYGLDGYVLWRCFPFAPPASTSFEALFGELPAAFEVRSLDQPPVSYAGKLAAGRKEEGFTAGVLAALDTARAAVPSSEEKGFARSEDSPV